MKQKRSRPARQIPGRIEIRSAHDPVDHVAIFMEIKGYPQVSMAFGSPQNLAKFITDLCSAGEKVWPGGPPRAAELEALTSAGLMIRTQEWIDLGACCACGQIGPQVCNIISMPVEAPIPGSGWGCEDCGLPHNGAVAVVCNECHEMQRPILRVCVGSPGDNNRVDYDENLSVFQHDHGRHN